MQKLRYSYLRLRPHFPLSKSKQTLITRESQHTIQLPNKTTLVFKQIFNDNTLSLEQTQQSQVDIFNNIGLKVLKIQEKNNKQKVNFTIISYGDTACGKTYTIFGTQKQKGLYFRVLQNLLSNGSFQNEISIKIIQIYNQKVFDLSSKLSKQIKQFSEAQSKSIKSYEQLKHFTTSSYKQHLCNVMNNLSGRSVIQVIVKVNDKEITFIDLPGHQISINPNQTVKKQIIFINQELGNFEQMMQGIKNCLLTKLNQQRFQKDNLFLIVHINPNEKEALNTLKKVQRFI